jgi:hypothetical protein
MWAYARRLGVFVSLLAAVGCGTKTKLVQVEGTVKQKGKPMPEIMVEFLPDAKDGMRSIGKTDENGHFVLATDDNEPGVVPGKHRVIVRDLGVFGGKFLGRKLEHAGEKGGPVLKPNRVPDNYTTALKTPLVVEVTGNQSVDLDVAPR